MPQKNKILFFVIMLTFLVAISLLGIPVFAQQTPDFGLTKTAELAGLSTTQRDPVAVTSSIINSLLGIVGVVTVVVILYGGFIWLTAAGNEEKISQAKKLLGGAVVGLFIILSAYTISSFVIKSLSDSTKGAATPATKATDCKDQGGTCMFPTCVNKKYAGPTNECREPDICCVPI